MNIPSYNYVKRVGTGVGRCWMCAATIRSTEPLVEHLYENLNSIVERANSVDQDEVAHDEPPHLDLLCLQFQLFSSLGASSVKC